MRTRSLILLLLGCLSLGSPAPAAASVAVLRPVEDVSVPFWCEWGYDWDERCYRDDSSRLSIGGDVDKIWRAALRFSLGALPPGAVVQEAWLGLWYDATCVGRYGSSRRCDGRSWTVDAHGIRDPDWLGEREVEFDPSRVDRAVLPAGAGPQWLILDVTAIVAAWATGEAANAGILLKLADSQEAFLGSGPRLPSAGFGTASLRPWLEVAYGEPPE
ncbi:MAG: DNRLRE domain-containing protein [Gaiellaceae bacterium]